MILKVSRRDESSSSWVFVDGVIEATTEMLFLMKTDDVPSPVVGEAPMPAIGLFRKVASDNGESFCGPVHIDKKLLPCYIEDWVLKGKRTSVRVRLIRLLLRDGTYQSIASYDAAYLLNDEGKTIERI